VTISERHAEIARRYKRKDKAEQKVSRAVIRCAELRRLLLHRYGPELPDDDAGRDDFYILACHLTFRPDAERNITVQAGLWCPWMRADEVAALVTKVIARPLRWSADKLGARLGLTEAERCHFGITTIGAVGVSKEMRLRRRLVRKQLRKKLMRRACGVKSRAEYEAGSTSRNKPWEALGMSRRSWYRAGKPKGEQ
jgi:hypothetical protein